MKIKGWMLVFLSVVLIAACQEASQTTPQQEDKVAGEKVVAHELLFDLNFVPHEMGNTITVIEEEALYQKWAEIFKFPTVPDIDFATEEVLFVTTYEDGCGRIFEQVALEEDTLIVTLNYPKSIQRQREIVCAEIAIPKTFVVKIAKTDASYGTLIDINRVVLDKVMISP